MTYEGKGTHTCEESFHDSLQLRLRLLNLLFLLQLLIRYADHLVRARESQCERDSKLGPLERLQRLNVAGVCESGGGGRSIHRRLTPSSRVGPSQCFRIVLYSATLTVHRVRWKEYSMIVALLPSHPLTYMDVYKCMDGTLENGSHVCSGLTGRMKGKAVFDPAWRVAFTHLAHS